MKNQKIVAIENAFSQTPGYYHIGKHVSGNVITTINYEVKTFMENGDPMQKNYYIVRDMDGNKICEFPAESMNVFYGNIE